MGNLFRYLFIGTLTFIPLIVVAQLIVWLNSLSVELFKKILNITDSYLYTSLIIFLSLFVLVLVGFTTEKFGKAMFINWIERILEDIPAIGKVYSIVKKITNLFMSSKKDEKKEVVLVEYPKEGMWVIAYVLSQYENSRVLFIPTSPNPTSGYTVIVDKKMIKPTTLTISEASQFIVSMGVDFVKKEEIDKIITKK